MTTQELIAKVLELDATATKGPWWAVGFLVEGPGGDDIATTSVGLAEYARDCEANSETIAHYRTAAPILARMLQKAIEQRNSLAMYLREDEKIESWKKWAANGDAELDRIAKGE